MEPPPLYDQVHDLAVAIVNANSTRTYWAEYRRLRRLCEKHEGSANEHPFQWETLADFTTDGGAALELYGKALRKAENLALNEYTASIKLSMAQRHLELGQAETAASLARAADAEARTTDNLDLRREISEFLLELSGNT